MINELVILNDFGVTHLKGIPVVSSRKVAEVFEKEHKNVLRAIDNHIDTARNEDSGLMAQFCAVNFIESSYKERGKKYPEYILSRDGFSFVAMGFTGEKAAMFKISYINRFNEMEEYIESRNIARMESRDLTDAIQALHDPPKHYHYSSEFDMINRIVLGVTSKQFRLQHGLPKETSTRDYLTLQQIDEIKRLQSFDAHLANVITDYKQRQKLLQEYYGKIYTRNTELTGT